MTRQRLAVEFKGLLDGRQHSDGRSIFRAVATTPALDRYGEVVLPEGAITDNFKRNPVLVGIHDYSQVTIGQVVDLSVTPDQMIFDFVFAQDELGKTYEDRYKSGDMNAFSIGFRPVKGGAVDLWMPWDDEPALTEAKFELPTGKETTLDLTKYDQIPYRVYCKWELLEISAVPIPANPEALLMRRAEEIVRRAVEKNPVMKSFVQEDVHEKLGAALKMLEEFAEISDEDYELRGAVPTHSTPCKDGGDWSASAARTELAKWASSDGSGNKEKMNWAKYRKGFGWFVAAAPDNFGSYKLPHHIVESGELIAVWAGVRAAMSALLGARGGSVDESDKEAVYRHLARHYKDFNQVPPEMKDYTDDELKAIEEAPLVTVKEAKDAATEGEALAHPATGAVTKAEGDSEPGDGTSAEPLLETEILTTVKEVLSIVKQMAQKMSDEDEQEDMMQESLIEMNIRLSTLHDMVEAAPAKKAVEHKEPEQKTLFEVSTSAIADLEKLIGQ